jgi:FkbM family methyltransferase
MDKFISQTGQDVWAYNNTGKKSGGFYLDIGAHDGKLVSNTHYLDHEQKWQGICIEANPTSFAQLAGNRSARCIPVNAALYHTAGKELSFVDCSVGGGFTEYRHKHAGVDERYAKITVTTQVIGDVLETHMPVGVTDIDFMSIDVEGAELDILSVFPWDQYRIGLICIEHNGSMIIREQFCELLTAHDMIHTEDVSADGLFIHKHYNAELGQFTDGYDGGMQTITHLRDLELPPAAKSFREQQFVAHRSTGHTHHLGRFRSKSDGNWYQDVRQPDRSIVTTPAKELRQ